MSCNKAIELCNKTTEKMGASPIFHSDFLRHHWQSQLKMTMELIEESVSSYPRNLPIGRFIKKFSYQDKTDTLLEVINSDSATKRLLKFNLRYQPPSYPNPYAKFNNYFVVSLDKLTNNQEIRLFGYVVSSKEFDKFRVATLEGNKSYFNDFFKKESFSEEELNQLMYDFHAYLPYMDEIMTEHRYDLSNNGKEVLKDSLAYEKEIGNATDVVARNGQIHIVLPSVHENLYPSFLDINGTRSTNTYDIRNMGAKGRCYIRKSVLANEYPQIKLAGVSIESASDLIVLDKALESKDNRKLIFDKFPNLNTGDDKDVEAFHEVVKGMIRFCRDQENIDDMRKTYYKTVKDSLERTN